MNVTQPGKKFHDPHPPIKAVSPSSVNQKSAEQYTCAICAIQPIRKSFQHSSKLEKNFKTSNRRRDLCCPANRRRVLFCPDNRRRVLYCPANRRRVLCCPANRRRVLCCPGNQRNVLWLGFWYLYCSYTALLKVFYISLRSLTCGIKMNKKLNNSMKGS